jgi:HAD superfamily hydrolase (TIGR01509 family)
MNDIRALLWDVDGTLAETERDGHRVAFNQAFEDAGLPWRWDEARYGELLGITGGRERILYDMRERGDAPGTGGEREALARDLHARKNRIYGEIVRQGRVSLRPGVMALLDETEQAGLRSAIVTTTSRVNVDALLGVHLGPRWQRRFAAVVCGEDVQSKKPDPQAYLLALQTLKLGPLQCVAIEDSPGGVAAARAAEIPVIVPLSAYFAHATIDAAVAIGPGLHTRDGWRPSLRPVSGADERVTLDDVLAWCAACDTVSQFG